MNQNGHDPLQNESYSAVDSEEEEEVVVDDGTESLPLSTIACILSTAFSYGCILTTLFIITLPIECERISHTSSTPKSVALGAFVSIAGATQLVSPIIGRLSDTYKPPAVHEIGQRMPFLVLGAICTVIGLLGQTAASFYGLWMRYGVAFFLSLIGLNIMYAMMIALLPDQVPRHQTGVANGILALELVTGSLFGFVLFHSFLYEEIQSMYALYIAMVIVSAILTGTHAHDKDAELAYRRISKRTPADQPMDEETPLLTSPPSPKKWHRKAAKTVKKTVHKAAKQAKKIVLTPTLIVKSMLVDPFETMDWHTVYQSYTIDREKYHDFFVVTVSRLFYYCGMSVQTFFLYFVHDIIGVHTNPEAAVASLAILGQLAAALTCYPVGMVSDSLLGGRRKPFVYLACAILSSVTLALLWAKSMHDMVLFCLVLGAANGIYLTMDTSLAVDTLPTDFEGDTGSAQLLGVWGVAAFLGSALGPMIGGPLLYFVGSVDSDDGEEEYSLRGYAVIMGLSSFYFLCSAVSLRYVRSLHE